MAGFYLPNYRLDKTNTTLHTPYAVIGFPYFGNFQVYPTLYMSRKLRHKAFQQNLGSLY